MKTYKWRIPLLITVLGFIVVLVTIKNIVAHQEARALLELGDHAVSNPFFESTTPEITCNIDGRTFTYVRQFYCDGILIRDYWHDPGLVNHPEVTMKFELHGAGWLRTKI